MSEINLSELFPYEERKAILRKSNIIFKKDMDTILRFWRRFADPLRGTLLKAYNKYVLISHTEPDIIHVSDIVRMIVYNEVSEAIVADEKKIRLLARGVLYHHLFKLRFGSKISSVFEFPVVLHIHPFTIIGNIDVIIPANSGYYILEIKSSSTETTINFGVLQVKIYWCMLKDFYNLNVERGYVITPKTDVEVSEPLTKRELRKLIKIYAKLSRKLEEVTSAHELSTRSNFPLRVLRKLRKLQ